MKHVFTRLAVLLGLFAVVQIAHAAPPYIPKDFSITDEERAIVNEEVYRKKWQSILYLNRSRDIDKIVNHVRSNFPPEVEKMVVTNPELGPEECSRSNPRSSYDMDDGTPGSRERNTRDPVNDLSCGRLVSCLVVCVRAAGMENDLNRCDRAMQAAACYKDSPYQTKEFSFEEAVWWGYLRSPTMMFASAYGKTPYKRKTKTVYPQKK